MLDLIINTVGVRRLSKIYSSRCALHPLDLTLQ